MASVKHLTAGVAQKQHELSIAKANLIRMSAYNRSLHHRTTSAMVKLLEIARRGATAAPPPGRSAGLLLASAATPLPGPQQPPLHTLTQSALSGPSADGQQSAQSWLRPAGTVTPGRADLPPPCCSANMPTAAPQLSVSGADPSRGMYQSCADMRIAHRSAAMLPCDNAYGTCAAPRRSSGLAPPAVPQPPPKFAAGASHVLSKQSLPTTWSAGARTACGVPPAGVAVPNPKRSFMEVDAGSPMVAWGVSGMPPLRPAALPAVSRPADVPSEHAGAAIACEVHACAGGYHGSRNIVAAHKTTKQRAGGCAAGECSVCFPLALPPPEGTPGSDNHAAHAPPQRSSGASGTGEAAAAAAIAQLAGAMHAYRQGTAAGRGITPQRAQWLVCTPFPLQGSGAVSLAFSTAGSDASCRRSMHAFMLAARLEFCFATVAMDSRADTGCEEGRTAALKHSILETLRPLLCAPRHHGVAAVSLTASDGSRVPAEPGCAAIVGAICRLHAARLQPAQWMRACGHFADMHAADACMCAREASADAACMCCGMQACMLAALWNCIQMRAEPERSATLPPQPNFLRARFQSILSALNAMRTHCPLRELLATTQACGAQGDAAQATAGLLCVAQFYQQLPQPQRARLAGVWHAWRSGRRALDAQRRNALLPLRHLPGFAALHRSMLLIDAGPTAHNALFRDCGAGCVARPLHRHRTPWSAALRVAEGSAPVAAKQPRAVAQREGLMLLGASTEAQAAADSAMAQLAAAQHSASANLRDWVRAGSTPGVFFSLEQLEQGVHLSCAHRVTPGDWLLVCRMSADDMQRSQAFEGIAHMLDL